MESSSDKHWAQKYLLDPLNAPEPSEETGPGAHFTRDSSVTKAFAKSNVHERDSKSPTVSTSSKAVMTPSTSAYPTPPSSASPTRNTFHPSNPYSSASSSSHRQSAFSDYAKPGPSRLNGETSSSQLPGRRRGSSLGERFPGDMSHRPLDQIRSYNKAANRAPHLRKKHIPGADTIDSLDRSIFGAYHHEGPYDATLLARNISYQSSPVAAVRESNEAALRATPRERVQDSLVKKVPLSGVAVIPPGMAGLDGKVMEYEEGADLMREPDAQGGAYRRWEHVKYLPEDLKGKGEPSYSIEKALKEHKHSHRRNMSEGQGYEMQPQRRRSESTHQRSMSGNNMHEYAQTGSAPMRMPQADVQRSNTTGRKVGEGLKKRFGSIRRGKKTAEV